MLRKFITDTSICKTDHLGFFVSVQNGPINYGINEISKNLFSKFSQKFSIIYLFENYVYLHLTCPHNA